MKKLSLEKRMKMYEELNKQFLFPNQYVLMRLDGKSFSSFTKKYFNKPFDDEFTWLMQSTMEYLVDNISGAVAGYTQSDEITILLTDKKTKGMEGWFNYRVDKMCSLAASMASAYFNINFNEYYNKINNKCSYPYPIFDCRVWQVPNEEEVKNVFLWRQRDCIRNSVLQLAQSFYTHKEMLNKNIDELKMMLLKEKDCNWEDLNESIKYGMFYFPKKKASNSEKYFYCQMKDDSLNNEFTRIFNDVYEW
jgi:tRNA(His) 5'-end guanylyltransferase